jgi:hypothetical protein
LAAAKRRPVIIETFTLAWTPDHAAIHFKLMANPETFDNCKIRDNFRGIVS